MPAIFEDQRVVTADEIDELGHVNNIVYLKWTQRAAVRHSDAQGWTTRNYRDLGQGWVVRSHFIEYLQAALEGDEIIIRTWVADMKRVTSVRRFEVLRQRDQVLLARAETNWAFINFASGSLCRIPPQIASAFEIVVSPECPP